MEIAVLGIDLGKNSCSIVGLDAVGAVVLRRRMRREAVIIAIYDAPHLRRIDSERLVGRFIRERRALSVDLSR